MKLWVLRHGEAEPYGARPDPERALTAHGREEVLRSAAQLIGQPLAAIYASPYLRAQQTAQLVREALGFQPELITVNWLTRTPGRKKSWSASRTRTMCCWSVITPWWAACWAFCSTAICSTPSKCKPPAWPSWKATCRWPGR